MRCGTTSRAAEVLGITQPAVSRSIVEFERSVGFPLFARIRNRLVATPEGRMLYDEIKAALHGLDSIRATAARIRDQGSGEIRVASLLSASHSVVPRAVAVFQRKHPNVRITLLSLPSRDVRGLIVSGQFDVGLAADLIDTTGVVHHAFIAGTHSARFQRDMSFLPGKSFRLKTCMACRSLPICRRIVSGSGSTPC